MKKTQARTIVVVFLVSLALAVLQDAAKDETESWLKRHGYWPT